MSVKKCLKVGQGLRDARLYQVTIQ